MSARRTGLWLPVGCLWALAAILTLWNFSRIDALRAARIRMEEERLEHAFLEQNARRIQQIRDEHLKLALAADSIQLGELHARKLIEELAAALHLAEMTLTAGAGRKEAGSVDFNLAFRGAPEPAMRFLLALDGIAFLQLKEVVLAAEAAAGQVAGELRLVLQCRVNAPVEAADPPPEPSA
jgi:hypothetical protein